MQEKANHFIVKVVFLHNPKGQRDSNEMNV